MREGDCGANEGAVCSTWPEPGEPLTQVVVVWVQPHIDVYVSLFEREHDWAAAERFARDDRPAEAAHRALPEARR